MDEDDVIATLALVGFAIGWVLVLAYLVWSGWRTRREARRYWEERFERE